MDRTLEIKDGGQEPAEQETYLTVVDGKIPVPFELAGQRVFKPELMMQAELTLLAACSLRELGAYREAFGFALRASQELFTAIGTVPSTQEPLRHLFEAILELDKGRTDHAFRVKNRKGDSGSEWSARAALCLVLQSRVDSGETEPHAAEAIRKKFPIVPGAASTERALPVGRLMDWRKQFRSKTKQPPSGADVWETGIQKLNQLNSLPFSIEREKARSDFEKRLLELAAILRSRTTPKPDAEY